MKWIFVKKNVLDLGFQLIKKLKNVIAIKDQMFANLQGSIPNHTNKNSYNKWTKILTLETNILKNDDEK